MISNIKVDFKKSIKECLKKIEKNTFGICFVTKNHKLIGSVTDGDIRRAILKNSSLNSKVGSIANKKFSYVYENYDYLELQEKIKKFR